MKTTFYICLAIVLARLLSAGSAFATDHTVKNLNDSGSDSLRAAIAASSANDNILFQGGLSGTITLTSGELQIPVSLTILGPVGNILTVSGNNLSRVFNISSTATVTIFGLTISDGLVQGTDGTDDAYAGSAQGGGIINSGTLTLQNCEITGNVAVGGQAGTYEDGNGGYGEGGGIYSSGLLTVYNCRVLLNQAKGGAAGAGSDEAGDANGGGICSFGGVLWLYNSTVAWNYAYAGQATGDALDGGCLGGGIVIFGDGNVLDNCTIAGNYAVSSGPSHHSITDYGGGIAANGAVSIMSCTITGNIGPEAGGLWEMFDYDITLGNTIVSGNVADVRADVEQISINSSGFNLIGQTDPNDLNEWLPSDLIGTYASPINAQLGPLQDNGGPTLTIAPSPTSPAIDQGYSFGNNTDQRGYPRPVIYYPYRALPSGGDGSDIGAFELTRPRLSINPFPSHRLVIGWSENQSPAGGQTPAPFYGVQVAYPGNPIYPNSPVVWTNINGFVRPMGNQYVALDELGSGPVFYQLSSGASARFIPGPVTLSASNITTTSATLYASDIPVGSNTLYWFEYGTDTNYTNGVTVTNGLATSTNPASLSGSITGLSPGTRYHFQVVVTDDWGTQYGGDTNFTTPSTSTAVTLAATAVTSGNAQLNGTVDPDFADTTWWFEYGYDTNYSLGNTASAIVSASNTNAVGVNVIAGGLAASTFYHYQLVASNSAGVSYGGDQQFTTLGLPPTVTTLAASAITATTATLNGTVDGNGSPIAGYFQYSTDLSYSNNTSGNQFYGNNNYYSTQSFSATISNLAPNTTYNYRILAFGASEAFGINTSFTTAAGGQLPTAVTDGATNATLISGYTYSAMFLATVNPNGADTTVYFAYGTSTDQLTNSTPPYDLGSGTNPANYNYSVTNLNQLAAATWYFSIIASNSVGVANEDILNVTLP